MDGFEASLREVNQLYLGNKSARIYTLYWIFPKIDGFENPSLKIDGFGRTPRTRANAAPAM